ncbi:Uncharacterised protein [Mycobacteroides abscessus subsp. abscessus]|nr:Uncharacterised protein [Mycobacteroides abscessus subsp. abscessus]
MTVVVVTVLIVTVVIVTVLIVTVLRRIDRVGWCRFVRSLVLAHRRTS